jgi:hypothetical protein
MAWTSPRTWTTGELVTAAIMNTHIRDNQNVLNPTALSFFLDGGGSEISSGSYMPFSVPWDCTVSRWDVMLDSASDIALDVYAVSIGGWPASEDSIASGSPAFTASSACGTDSTPGWDAMSQGDQGLIVVCSIDGPTKATLTLYLART